MTAHTPASLPAPPKRPLSVTAQELDPIGRVTAYYFTIAVSVLSLGTALALTLVPSGRTQLSDPILAALSIVTLAVALTSLVIMVHPGGSMLTRVRFQIVFFLVIAATVLSSLSQLGSNHSARDDWGPISLSLALLACAPYRTSREILWFTFQGVLVTGALAVLQASTSETIVSESVLIVVAIIPALSLGLSAAAYSRSLVTELRLLRKAGTETRLAVDNETSKHASDHTVIDKLGTLRTEVTPFFEHLLAQGEMLEPDAERAIELSTGIRLAIVERLSSDPLAGIVSQFTDNDGTSRRLDGRQRAALRAIIERITALDSLYQGSLTLSLWSKNRQPLIVACGSLTFDGTGSDQTRTALQPFIHMLGFVFDEIQLTYTPHRTVVSFSAAQQD